MQTTPIVLDAHYTVTPDASCWQLTYLKEGDINPETGKPMRTVSHTFHPSLAYALHTYLDESLKECSTIQAVIDEIKAVEDRIEKATKGVKR